MRFAGIAVLVWTAATGGGAPPSGTPTPAPSLIGFLVDAELPDLPRACECEFVRGALDVDGPAADPRTAVFATRQERSVGLAKVGGTVVRLALVERREERDCRPGESRVERWQGGPGGSVRLILKLKPVRAGEEACWYRGTLTVTSGKKSETIPVTGSCGC